MNSASIVLAISLSVYALFVSASSSHLRELHTAGQYGYRNGHDRMKKSYSITDENYSYGGEQYGSLPKEIEGNGVNCRPIFCKLISDLLAH
jgi:hypothetical protein